MASAVAVLALSIPVAGLAFSWSGWISEEHPDYYAVCDYGTQAVDGVRCSGSYCDNVAIRCNDLPFGITTQSYEWSGWYSEESEYATSVSAGWYQSDADNSHVCKWGNSPGIMTGFACAGSNCDWINLECAFVRNNVGGVWEPARMTNCSWSAYYSEEDPWFAFGANANRWIAGVRCQGSKCDDKSYYVCSLQPAVNSCQGTCGGQAPDGCWCDSLCTSYGDCCGDFQQACQ